MTETTAARFSTGLAVKAAVALMAREPVRVLLLALLFAGLPDLAMTYLSEHFSWTGQGFATTFGWAMALTLATMMTGAMLQAAVTLIVRPSLLGPAANLDGAGSGLAGLAFSVVALGLVTSLGIMAGFVLLIIPGVILSMAWFVAVPAMVVERLGVIDAIKRSNHLTGNERGAIFGLWIVTGIMAGVVGWLTQLAITAVDNAVFTAIASIATQTVSGAVGAVLAVTVYQELRRSQEGTSEQALEAVFA